MRKIIISISILIAMTISVSATDYQLMSVSDYPFTMKGKQAVSIDIGKSDSEYFTITVQRDQIVEYNTISKDRTNPNETIDARGSKNGKSYYYLTRGAYSVIFFNILELNKKKHIARIAISLDLYNSDIKQYMRLKDAVYTIRGKQFDNLVKHIN